MTLHPPHPERAAAKPAREQPNPRAWLPASLTLALTVLTISAPQPANAADPARAKAKGHFATAERSYAAKQFDEAITEYTKAYEALPLPAFLFNIGQCHRSLEHHEEAITFYERYLQEAGTPEDRELVEQLITESKTTLESKPAPAPEPQTALTELTADPGTHETPSLTAEPAPQTPQLIAEAEAPETVELYEEWWFWPAVATVAAAVAGGTIIAVASSGGGDRTVLPSGSAGTLDWR